MATNPFTAQTDDLIRKNTVTPDLNTFDESKSTAGRVASITSSGSPLMTLARTRATQQANARGLRNSSIAAGAGERAVIETATPMAAQDASLFQQSQLANQNAKNTAQQFNANLGASLGAKGLEMGENSRQFDTSAGLEKERMTTQESQFGRSLMEQARQANQSAGLQGQQLSQQDRQFTANLEQQANQFKGELAQRQQQIDAQREQFAQQLGLDTGRLDLARSQLSQEQQQFLAGLDLKQKELTQQGQQFEANLTNQRTLAQMDADNRIKLIETEAAYRTEIGSNDNIAGAWATMMQGISQIQNNPEIEASAKGTLIQNQLDAFKSFSGFWKKVTGGTVDVSDLLNFGMAPAPSGGTPENPVAGSTGSNTWGDPSWMSGG